MTRVRAALAGAALPGVALLGAWLTLPACHRDAPAPANAAEVTLVYSGNVDGEIEPCG
jgi:hypothetical protein